MAAKAVVRDTGRVLGHPYGFVDGIAKLIPNTLGISLDDAMGESEASRQDSSLASADLIQRYHSEEDVRDLVDLARSLEDLTRNAGKHAGGVVIAPSPLSDFCPLFAEHDGEGRGRNPVTQFDKDDVEAVGLVKFDFLGLRTLTIIDWAVKAINKRRAAQGQPALDIAALPLDDKPSYELFARGDTVAVFQFESRGMRELLKRARPDTFEDIIALAALFRPGPLGSGMDREWVDRKHGNTEVTYPHDSLEPVLSPTYGVIVYQEQVMQIAQVLAGYTLGGADMLRRAMGKKKPEEMAKERAKFEAGCKERGIDARQSSPIFDLMEKFAEYGFNKSHSAAYALVAYQTAWLKVHYPAEFMAAVLSSDMDNTDKVTSFLDECRVMGLTVLPPDVDQSAYMFEAKDATTIRYGLGAVKGVGRGACEAIVEARRAGAPDGRFADLLDFAKRVDSGKLNRRALEALTQAGALDNLGKNRASLMLQLPEVLKATDQLAKEREAGQSSLFGGGLSGGFEAAPALHLDLPEVDEWPLTQILHGERETLGHYLSGHPFDPYREELVGLIGNDLSGLEKIWENRPEPARGTLAAGSGDGGRRPGRRASQEGRQPDVRADRGRPRPPGVRLLQRELHRVRAAAGARPPAGDPGRPARGQLQRRLRPARIALLGLRTGLRAPCATPVAARGPARTRHVAAHRPGAGPQPSRPDADPPGPAAASRRGRHARPQRHLVDPRRRGPAFAPARDAGRARGEADAGQALGELNPGIQRPGTQSALAQFHGRAVSGCASLPGLLIDWGESPTFAVAAMSRDEWHERFLSASPARGPA